MTLWDLRCCYHIFYCKVLVTTADVFTVNFTDIGRYMDCEGKAENPSCKRIHREKENRIERMGPEKPGLLPPPEVLRGKFHG